MYIIYVFICSLQITVLAVDKSETYGPYKVSFERLNKVQGVKKVDCNEYEIKFDKHKNELGLLMNVTKNVAIVQSKILVYVVKQNNKKLLVQYNLKKPCEHFLMGQYYVALFNTTKSCLIKKGIYRMKVDVNEILQKFFGANFFYGEYIMKGYTIANNCDFVSMESIVNFVKKL